ncbi:related to L-2.3-butanediol dehydrogenase [Fusarium fujikuroi]|nr:related to L-2.3-butanediol dehydrogenase [Fusarium fujikuroi]
MASFDGKTIAITGAASGIGFAVAKLLASRRAQLSLADMNKAGLEAALRSLPGDGHIITQVDVRDSQEVNAWIEKTVSVFAKLDGAVIGMSRSAAKENENIRINCPFHVKLQYFWQPLSLTGSVRTPMMEGEGMAEAVEAEVALQV